MQLLGAGVFVKFKIELEINIKCKKNERKYKKLIPFKVSNTFSMCSLATNKALVALSWNGGNPWIKGL